MASPEAGTAKPGAGEEEKGVPVPEAGAPASDPEAEAKVAGTEAAKAEEIFSSLSPENESLLDRASGAGREILSEAYGRLENTGVVGRMAMAYHGFFARRYEDKALAHKANAEKADMQIRTLEESKTRIAALLQELDPKLAGTAGQLQSRAIDDQIRNLAGKKDKSLSAFEAAQNRATLRRNERDRVADRLIGGYDERLKPLESEISGLQGERDETEFLAASMEARHEETLLTLAEKEAELQKGVAAIERAGLKLKNFPGLKMIEVSIASGRKKIKAEKDELERRKLKVEEKIAKAEERANPYRDKRENVVRVKQGRPIEIAMPQRVRTESSTVRPETVGTSVRSGEASSPGETGDAETEEEAEEDDEAAAGEEGAGKAKKAEAGAKETAKKPERPGKFSVELLVSEWNKVLKSEKKLKGTEVIVDVEDFIKKSKLKDIPVRLNLFEKLLKTYYRMKKVSVESFGDKFAALGESSKIKPKPRKKRA